MSARKFAPRTAEVFAPLWTGKARYKAAYGGRGSGKSNDRAQAVIAAMLSKPGCRVVCVREVQNSIKDSVKQLLSDWIQRHGLGGIFDVLDSEIRGPNGSLCIFRGMNDQNNETIKSLEGFDIAWWEEAQTASQRSIDLLRPTIRKAGSEIWFTWNPRFKSDPVDKFLRQGSLTEQQAIVVEANYQENPWFGDELEEERQIDLSGDYDRYAHIWLGKYEKASDAQLINAGLVEEARNAKIMPNEFDELIMGVDVARFGDDETVIAYRCGRDANCIQWQVLLKKDTMEVASFVAAEVNRHRPDAVMIDETGVGGGVVDRLRQLGIDVIPVNFSSRADNLTKVKTANKRAEMWVRLKEWLEEGQCRIPDDDTLEAEMTSVLYKHDANNSILLEKKEEMKKRGIRSPDRADALALTFAYPVMKKGFDVAPFEVDVSFAGRNMTTGY